MALTVSTGTNPGRNGPNVMGQRKTAVLRLSFDDSYPTGGEAIAFSQYVDFTPDMVFVSQRLPVDVAYVFTYDHAGQLLQAFWVDTSVDGAALAEVADETDLSAVVVDVLLIGD
jgi:hypothetical protein